MTAAGLAAAALASAAALAGGGAALASGLRRRARMALRVGRAQGLVLTPEARRARGGPSPMAALARLGTAVTESGVLPKKTIRQLEETLIASGLSAENALPLFIGGKVLLAASLPTLAAASLRGKLEGTLYALVIAVAFVGGLLAPDYAIGKIRKKHLAKVEAGLADALDMMVICAEAGLGMEPAIARVSLEMVHVHPALAQELARTTNELQVIVDNRVALTNMGGRTGLDSLRRLGGTLVQTLQYGTPLGVALRQLSAELRQETLTKFEERAARLPVLLTMPMILFILPCVFLIVGGPAVIQLVKIMNL